MPDAVTTTRKRVLPSSLPSKGVGVRKTPPNSVLVTEGYADWSGRQVTVSEGHAFHSAKGRKGKEDLGGPFYTSRSYVKSGVTQDVLYREVKGSGGTTTYQSVGPVLPTTAPAFFTGGGTQSNPYKPKFPATQESSTAALNQLGATAIANCEPTKSAANVTTFLGELLKDGLPSLVGASLWKDKTDAARKAGSEYLNVQFGWQPLVSDIRKFADAVKHADTILDQYERDAGQVVRRRFSFPTTKEVITNLAGVNNVNATTLDGNAYFVKTPTGNVRVVREIERRRWFSGAFTYYIPSDYDSRSQLRKYALLADKLIGLELTPETIWNLAPWSWAIDWFSNAGDVLHNISAFATGGLVMRYGYMMEHTTVTDTISLTPASLVPEAAGCTVGPLVFVTETKRRIKANPFGFGVSWDGLSSFQLSILAALGMTRGR